MIEITNKYDDIINLKHHTSSRYPRMSIYKRAVQFAPFAALTGYSEAIKETARLTHKKIEISEDMKKIIDMKLQIIDEHIKERPEIKIMYFEEDKMKAGGEYIEYTGNLKRLDMLKQVMIFTGGLKVNINNIFDIKTDLLKIMD